jgi:hypothetical protein
LNAFEFQSLVLTAFPELREDFAEWDGLYHLQVGEFRRFTQSAIEAQRFDVVSRCFEIATAALMTGDRDLRNAIYVSYLEHIELRSDAGKQAAQRMPAELRQGRYDVLDYNQQLLGRKWPTDDR